MDVGALIFDHHSAEIPIECRDRAHALGVGGGGWLVFACRPDLTNRREECSHLGAAGLGDSRPGRFLDGSLATRMSPHRHRKPSGAYKAFIVWQK